MARATAARGARSHLDDGDFELGAWRVAMHSKLRRARAWPTPRQNGCACVLARNAHLARVVQLSRPSVRLAHARDITVIAGAAFVAQLVLELALLRALLRAPLAQVVGRAELLVAVAPTQRLVQKSVRANAVLEGAARRGRARGLVDLKTEHGARDDSCSTQGGAEGGARTAPLSKGC